MDAPLIEFPADDPDRALRFWTGVLGVELAPRTEGQGSGWEAESAACGSGCTSAAAAPATPPPSPTSPSMTWTARWSASREHGGSVIHPGERWSICRDSEGSPFALAALR